MMNHFFHWARGFSAANFLRKIKSALTKKLKARKIFLLSTLYLRLKKLFSRRNQLTLRRAIKNFEKFYLSLNAADFFLRV